MRNLSRLISLSLVDEGGNEIPIRTSVHQPVEMIIPRDPSFRLPPMSLHNVTSLSNDSLHHLPFNLHSVALNQTSSFALHLEVQPLTANLSYLMIYRFDRAPTRVTSCFAFVVDSGETFDFSIIAVSFY